MQTLPEATYNQQIEKHKALLDQQLKKRVRLGWSRLIVFILTIIISYKIFVAAGVIGLVAVVVGLAILLYLVSLDANNNSKIKNTKTLIHINEEELKILENNYHQRYDGAPFLPAVHNYANDLDIFGKASLYQYINRCYTEQGRTLLAENLLQPLLVTEVKLRHEAIKEVTPLIDWRQQLESFAMQNAITVATQLKAQNWLKKTDEHFTGKFWKSFVVFYSVVTVVSAIATILGYIPASLFSLLFIVYVIVSLIISRNAVGAYLQLSGIVKEISTMYSLVEWIEQKDFNSTLLKNLQQQSKCGDEKASTQIKQLKNILDRFDLRISIIGVVVLNPFLLWDVRQIVALNTWRKKNKSLLSNWFAMIAETEVINSLSVLHFNQFQWCFPKFSSEYFTYEADELGHPLLPNDQRVTSNYNLEGVAKIGLVTGSNMAGKSTFLRSLGLSVVMAQIGAPVCAKSFALSPVGLMSSMRIADNLAENTSTFYAELKKLKTIIEAVNKHERIFILLDEILRGTNSLDRHTGSKALIKQLIHQKAVAVIATHDVDLAELEKQFPASIENYHFDVQVKGEELFFDYKLKEGVCKSLNASILMKKIGIELSE